MRNIWAGSLSVVLGLTAAVQSGEPAWRPAGSAGQGTRAPVAALDRPTPRNVTTAAASPPDAGIQPVAASMGGPAPVPTIVRAQGFDPGGGPPPVPPPTPIGPPPLSEPFNQGMVSEAPTGGFMSYVPGVSKGWFRSDSCFNQFISPVTNPFLFEDPRSLTEARPIFIYQSSPLANPRFRGGNQEFFGTQYRLAITDRFSFVINKMGFIHTDPNDQLGQFDSSTGFSELWLGPKYTIIRNENTNTLLAAGLQFQIPTGPNKVFQNTGNLSLVPYLSLGQNFWQTSYGSVNFLGTFGYSFATDNVRSDYLFLSMHLDYDIANLHKIYPLIELNYFQYTANGNARSLNFEGRDLINFGSRDVAGNGSLSIATGFRYKFSEGFQTGLGVEWPIAGQRDIMDFRLTADLIFRY